MRGDLPLPAGGCRTALAEMLRAACEFVQNTAVFPVSRTIDGAGADAGQRRKLAAVSGPYLIDDASRMPGVQEAAIRRMSGAVGEAVGAEPVLDNIYWLSQGPCDFGQQLQLNDRFVSSAAVATAMTDERDNNVVFPAGDDLVRMCRGRHVHFLWLLSLGKAIFQRSRFTDSTARATIIPERSLLLAR